MVMVKKLGEKTLKLKVDGHLSDKATKVFEKLGYVADEGAKMAKAKKADKPYKTPKRMVRFFEKARTCPECKKPVTLTQSYGRKLKFYEYHQECAAKVIGKK